MKAGNIVVVGSANTDYTVRGKHLPKLGETTLGEQFHIDQGGKGANQAVAAARLDAQVALIARIGSDDRGDAMLRQLRDEGVYTQDIARDDEAPTGAAVIQVEEAGEKQIFMAPGANSRLTAEDVCKAAVWHNVQVVIMQLEIPIEAVREAIRLGHESRAKIILDPAPGIKLPDDLLQWLTLIKPNSREAEKLTGIKTTSRDSARRAAKTLLGHGVEAAAVQAGDEGDLLVWHGGEVWLPRIEVESVDATGAGDAFAAGMAVALVEGRSWQDAGHFASATAALTTTKIGAQSALPHRLQVDELMSRVMSERQ
jgi:ribokinase